MEKIKRFCRENARILLALGAVLAFCAVPLHRTDAREMPIFTKEPCKTSIYCEWEE